MSPLALALSAGLATALATLLLAGLARRIGWADGPEGGGRGRKWQSRPVPPVGGIAILAGLGVLALGPEGAAPLALGRGAVVSVALAFLVGLGDDLVRGGFGAWSKLALQAVAAAPFALGAAGGADGGGAWLSSLFLHGLAAVLAMNAFNTFDNADGALGTLSLVGFAVVAPPLAAPLLGFLPFNLDVRAGAGRRTSPTAYLGDAGSHLLGMLALAVPDTWPILLLPAIDLARLSIVRWRAGGRPWQGDRRHLAHRLAAAGLGRIPVAATLAALAAPCMLVPARLVWAGCLATLLLFAWVLARTPDPGRPGRQA